jgi:hypothetical protein
MPKPDLSEFFEQKPSICIAGKFVNKLTPDDKEKFEAALLESDIDTATLVRWLNKKGLDAKYPAVLRHRRKECICNG